MSACSALGCEKIAKARGLCNTHYERARLGRDDGGLPNAVPRPRCSVDGCESDSRSLGMCGAHYYKSRRMKRCPGCGVAISHSAKSCRPCLSQVATSENEARSEVRECHMCLRALSIESFRRYDRNRSYRQRHVNCIACEDAYEVLRGFIGPVSAMRLKAFAKSIGVPMAEIAETYPPDGACEGCGLIGVNGKRLALDHCHETKMLRGWLCDSCNTGIGLAGDNAAGVRRWLSYLERFEAGGDWL